MLQGRPGGGESDSDGLKNSVRYFWQTRVTSPPCRERSRPAQTSDGFLLADQCRGFHTYPSTPASSPGPIQDPAAETSACRRSNWPGDHLLADTPRGRLRFRGRNPRSVCSDWDEAAVPTGGEKEGDAPCHVRADLRPQRLEIHSKQGLD